jgi:hypothetical protein
MVPNHLSINASVDSYTSQTDIGPIQTGQGWIDRKRKEEKEKQMTTGIEIPSSPIEAARDIIARLKGIQDTVAGPDATTLTPSERRRNSSTAAVPEKYFPTVVATLESAPQLGTAAQTSAAELRTRHQYSQEFAGVVDEIARMLAIVQQHVMAEKAITARIALRVLRVARSFNSPADRELLFPHIEAMKKALGRVGRTKRKKSPDTPATPVAAGEKSTDRPAPPAPTGKEQ